MKQIPNQKRYAKMAYLFVKCHFPLYSEKPSAQRPPFAVLPPNERFGLRGVGAFQVLAVPFNALAQPIGHVAQVV